MVGLESLRVPTRSLRAAGMSSGRPIIQALSARLRHAAHAAQWTGPWAQSQSATRSAAARRAATTTARVAAPNAAGDTAGAAPGAAAAASYSDAADGAPRVCILGGGFGGLYTAVKLESLIWPKGKKPRVTLIDQGERFVFKPLLYELLNGTAQPWEVAPTFAQLLAPYPVQFVQAKVSSVEPDTPLADGGSAAGGRITLDSGGTVDYDYLVIALGAESDPRGIPGVAELARPFVTLEDASAVNERLGQLETVAAAGGVAPLSPSADVAGAAPAARRAPVVMVVGAGYAGVELASVIGERVKGRGVDVLVVTPADGILPGAPEGQRDAAQRALSDLGVRMISGSKVSALIPPRDAAAAAKAAAAVRGTGSCLAVLEGMVGGERSEVEADLVVWTAGLAPASKFVKSLPFPSTAAGAIETDATLRVARHARVFALGDVSLAEQAPAGSSGGGSSAGTESAGFPATAQVAFQQADYAAWNIWAAMNGRPLLPFRYQHLGSMMSLGAANAAVALPLELPAPLAATIKGTPLDSLLSLAGVKAAAPGGVTIEGPLGQLLRRAAYLYRQPTGEQRLSVAASWVQQAAEVAQRLAQQVEAAVPPPPKP